LSSGDAARTATVVAGIVGRAHGLQGAFYVSGPRPELLVAGAAVTIGETVFEIVRRAGTEDRPILGLAGIEDRAGAEALRGLEVRVPRPALEEDEYWAEDLEGCIVRDGDVEVGVVEALLPYPSCELLEVRRSGAADAEPLLVPLVRDAVRSIDVEARVVDVDLAFLGER
jgi:16S rRNA processing protein RimM